VGEAGSTSYRTQGPTPAAASTHTRGNKFSIETAKLNTFLIFVLFFVFLLFIKNDFYTVVKI
jgi:hypothetical protein